MEPFKYFVFNKKRDYEAGCLEQIEIIDHGIRLKTSDKHQSGTFISTILDAGNEGNKWHRAVVSSSCFGDDSIRFSVYCSDSRTIIIDNREWDWAELISNKNISLERKKEIMKPYLVHQILNPQDVLLYKAKGRFLWMEIQLFNQAEFVPEIHRMIVYADNKSFIEYLPEIYHSDNQQDFFRRYLSIFEAVYQDLDYKIRNSAKQLDPQTAEPEFLVWLARWVGIRDIQLWSEEKLRLLLNGIVKKNLLRGTKKYMEHVIEVYTGEKPIIVEYDEIETFRSKPDIYNLLKHNYAHGPYEINVLLNEEAVPTLGEQKALERIIEELKPAHMECHLIILRSSIYLDQNTYLGINSTAGSYHKAYLNSRTAIPSFIVGETIGGEE